MSGGHSGATPARSKKGSKKRDRLDGDDDVSDARMSTAPAAAEKTVGKADSSGVSVLPASVVETATAWSSGLSSSAVSHSVPAGVSAVVPSWTQADAKSYADAVLEAVASQFADDVDAVRKSDTFTGSSDQIEMFARVLGSVGKRLPLQSQHLLLLQTKLV